MILGISDVIHSHYILPLDFSRFNFGKPFFFFKKLSISSRFSNKTTQDNLFIMSAASTLYPFFLFFFPSNNLAVDLLVFN